MIAVPRSQASSMRSGYPGYATVVASIVPIAPSPKPMAAPTISSVSILR
jgi:hypothetical protein